MFIEFTPRYADINATYAQKINTLFRVIVDPTTGRCAARDSYPPILINIPEKSLVFATSGLFFYKS